MRSSHHPIHRCWPAHQHPRQDGETRVSSPRLATRSHLRGARRRAWTHLCSPTRSAPRDTTPAPRDDQQRFIKSYKRRAQTPLSPAVARPKTRRARTLVACSLRGSGRASARGPCPCACNGGLGPPPVPPARAGTGPQSGATDPRLPPRFAWPLVQHRAPSAFAGTGACARWPGHGPGQSTPGVFPEFSR